MTQSAPPRTKAGASRLIYGVANGQRLGPRRTTFAIKAATALDKALAIAGVARPVLLVSGFWRSGTTWLQESLAIALGAKTIFEPLAPMEPGIRQALAARFGNMNEDILQAAIPGPLAFDDPLWRDLDRAVFGRNATAYLLSCRRDAAESLRSKIVVKDVRLQANLAAAYHRYGLPAVHVRRHPCATVASLIAADWHWSFERAPLETLLPRLGAALDPSLRVLALGFDTDRLSRIAAFWAVTERIAEAYLAQMPWGALLSYERFAAEPEAALAAICARLDFRVTSRVDFNQPSASVHPDAFAAYAAAPAERWRGLLSPQQRDRVLTIADALHPGWRFDGILAA